MLCGLVMYEPENKVKANHVQRTISEQSDDNVFIVIRRIEQINL